MKLVQTLKSHSNTNDMSFGFRELEKFAKFEGKYFNGSYQFHVPHTLPATFSYRSPAKSTGNLLALSYELYFEVHIKRFYMVNVRLSVPVVVIDRKPEIVNQAE